MLRRISQQMIVILILSLVVYSVYVSQADDPYKNDANRSITTAEKLLNGKYRTADNLQDNLIIARGEMNKLIGKWEDNKAAISNGATMTVASAFGIAVGAYLSSGTVAATAVASLVVNAKKLGLAIYDHSDYVTSMEAVINKVAELTDQANTAVGAYKKEYNRYIGIMAPHLNYDAAWLEADVKASLTDDDVYHHPTDPQSSGSRGFHYVETRQDIIIPNLPNNYECDGPCTNAFNSPYKAFDSHREKCGTAENVEKAAQSRANEETTPYANWFPERFIPGILESRGVLEGCGRHYYNCPDFPDTEHQVFSCNKTKTNEYGTSVRCGTQFRPCMGHKEDHDLSDWISWKSKHSTTADSSDDDDSTEQDTEGLQTEQTQTSTPSYHACGVHETSVSGDHSAAGCGVSGHYVCDGSDHSLQASCTTTNASGQSCTASSFYACQTHTHQYPTTATCSQCNKVYTPSSYSSNRWHKARTCTKQKWLQVDGRWVKVRCTNTFYKCTNGNWQCATGEMWCRDADGS
ncbi:MAG: hypothetical protein OXM61_03090 [Candidatus Poribacteria bacterium]|nr:hypothetical protein [Candidatus Poribacteria bacterium]